MAVGQTITIPTRAHIGPCSYFGNGDNEPKPTPGIDPRRQLDVPAKILPTPKKEDYELPKREREKEKEKPKPPR